MTVEFTRGFDERFARLAPDLQAKCRDAISAFLDCYASRRFPKGLRVHKCGPFISLSVSMKHRIFVFPVAGGVKFVFVGDHADMEKYLKKGRS